MKERKKYPTTISKMINKEIIFKNYVPQTSGPRRLFFIGLFLILTIISMIVISSIVVLLVVL